MIKGADGWNNRDHHYSQENNPQEEMLRKAGISDWLETCGPTAAVNCIAAMGYVVDVVTPGVYRPQPESTLSTWFHDPRNYQAMERIRKETPPDEWMGNRIPQFYPKAVKDVFGIDSYFKWLDVFTLKLHIDSGSAVQVCLKKPGHYIAVLAFDDVYQEFIFNDSFPSRPGLMNRGFNERIGIDELRKNMQAWGIVYK